MASEVTNMIFASLVFKRLISPHSVIGSLKPPGSTGPCMERRWHQSLHHHHCHFPFPLRQRSRVGGSEEEMEILGWQDEKRSGVFIPPTDLEKAPGS